MKYFSINELCVTNTGLKNVPNTSQKFNLTMLIETVLDPLRERIQKPIKVNSGFRSTDVNRAVGGAINSNHLQGNAADIVVDGMSPKVLFSFILATGIFFNELILEPTWVHIALNPKKPKQRRVLKKTDNGYVAIK